MSIRCSITKINLTLENLAQSMPKEIVPEFVENLADACLDNAYKRAPWRSGFLAMSLTKKVDGNTAQVILQHLTQILFLLALDLIKLGHATRVFWLFQAGNLAEWCLLQL